MDRQQLENNLKPFVEACANKGFPISNMCVIEAYPGDISTSYILQVKAGWVNNMDCSPALDILFETLFESVEEDTRKFVFSIQVLDANEQLHCQSQTTTLPAMLD